MIMPPMSMLPWWPLVPKKVEARLKREAVKKFPDDKERQDRYIYGTMKKIEERGQ